MRINLWENGSQFRAWKNSFARMIQETLLFQSDAGGLSRAPTSRAKVWMRVTRQPLFAVPDACMPRRLARMADNWSRGAIPR